jgi:F-type H+-transporting ATPase subunit epsilon
MPLKVDIVTAEKVIYSEEADIVIAPGTEGQLGILPHHLPLMTTLEPGELTMRKAGVEFSLAIAGGFMEVRPDRVIVLADAAERADDIDLARAEAAKQRARDRITHHEAGVDLSQAEAALRRALARIRVAEKRRRRAGTM